MTSRQFSRLKCNLSVPEFVVGTCAAVMSTFLVLLGVYRIQEKTDRGWIRVDSRDNWPDASVYAECHCDCSKTATVVPAWGTFAAEEVALMIIKWCGAFLPVMFCFMIGFKVCCPRHFGSIRNFVYNSLTEKTMLPNERKFVAGKAAELNLGLSKIVIFAAAAVAVIPSLINASVAILDARNSAVWIQMYLYNSGLPVYMLVYIISIPILWRHVSSKWLDVGNVLMSALFFARYSCFWQFWYLENAFFMDSCRFIQCFCFIKVRLSAVLQTLITVSDVSTALREGRRGADLYVLFKVFYCFVIISVTVVVETATWAAARAILVARQADDARSHVQRLLSSMCDAVVHLNADLQLLRASPQLACLLLRTGCPTLLSGRNFLEFVAVADQQRFITFMNNESSLADTRSDESKPPVHALHLHLLEAYQRHVSVEIFASSIYELDGNLMHVVGIKEEVDGPELIAANVPEVQEHVVNVATEVSALPTRYGAPSSQSLCNSASCSSSSSSQRSVSDSEDGCAMLQPSVTLLPNAEGFEIFDWDLRGLGGARGANGDNSDRAALFSESICSDQARERFASCVRDLLGASTLYFDLLPRPLTGVRFKFPGSAKNEYVARLSLDFTHICANSMSDHTLRRSECPVRLIIDSVEARKKGASRREMSGRGNDKSCAQMPQDVHDTWVTVDSCDSTLPISDYSVSFSSLMNGIHDNTSLLKLLVKEERSRFANWLEDALDGFETVLPDFQDLLHHRLLLKLPSIPEELYLHCLIDLTKLYFDTTIDGHEDFETGTTEEAYRELRRVRLLFKRDLDRVDL
eukprot:TRINITY_DN8516_c0_g1_i8.p1 TRINITY_DN8516_c0_g1~~TRINITY_DN8516_c0_g1_i8.p1  ORF type:complete len:808 (-),score=111.01 TRINITY_DN8516_c0_g1_i8:39-2462(-)